MRARSLPETRPPPFTFSPRSLPGSRRRRAGRDDPEFHRAGLALAAVYDDDARGVYAARVREVLLRAVAALLARAEAPVTPAVGDDVPLRAGAVLELDGEDIEARLLVVAL